MLDLGKVLRPSSVLIGILSAAAVLAILFPFPADVGTTVGVATFAATAGLTELVRRVAAERSPPKKGKRQDD